MDVEEAPFKEFPEPEKTLSKEMCEFKQDERLPRTIIVNASEYYQEIVAWREKWEQTIKIWYEGYMRWHHFIVDTTTGLTPEKLKELEEKAEKWDGALKYLDLDVRVKLTLTIQERMEFEEAQRRLNEALTASDELKQTLRDWCQWDSPALREIWKGVNKLDSILRETTEGEWSATDLLKSLTESQLKELLQAVSLIVDPLGQELIKKAVVRRDEA